jgi:hypothetical protein
MGTNDLSQIQARLTNIEFMLLDTLYPLPTSVPRSREQVLATAAGTGKKVPPQKIQVKPKR